MSVAVTASAWLRMSAFRLCHSLAAFVAALVLLLLLVLLVLLLLLLCTLCFFVFLHGVNQKNLVFPPLFHRAIGHSQK